MNNFQKCLNMLLILTTLILSSSQVFATGVLFSRPRFSDQQYQKMWIKKIQTTVEIQDQIAVTHVDQIFYNELNTSVETVYIFPLPENAMITELVYWFNGQRYVAEIREREEAINDYNDKLRQWLDPALLEYLGDNLFRLRIVPVDALSEVRTEITYVEPLTYDLGIVSYMFLLNALDLSPKALETVSVEINARSQVAYKSFSSPTHGASTATQISKISDTHYQLTFGDENFYPDRDLVVEFETQRENIDMRILTYTPTEADSFGSDSFYALWITPPEVLTEQDIIPKDIIFTADVSSSMEGLRITQVKEALRNFVLLLNDFDRFNIIIFGTVVESFRPDLVPVTSQNKEDALDYIAQLYALGLTNIDTALLTSLQQSFGDTTSNNLVFLTDGEPTWGETDPDSIRGHVATANKNNVRIFSFGVGDEISEALLTQLSRENHGYAQFITSDDSIANVVDKHFMRISKPVLTDIHVDMGGLFSWDIYPKSLDDLFWGTQILQMGLYNGSGTYQIVLSGDVRSDSVSYDQVVEFADTSGGHRFVPRLWAKAKIEYLLELIAIYGESDELVNQIIDLSLRFQILTPYTALYSDPTAIENDEKTTPEQFVLYANYPNPFNPQTVIEYRIPSHHSSTHVIIRIYDVLGQLVRVLVDEQRGPGLHRVIWDGRDDSGKIVPSGVYFYRMECGDFSASHKMLLLR